MVRRMMGWSAAAVFLSVLTSGRAVQAGPVSPALYGTVSFVPGVTTATIEGTLPNQATPLELSVDLPTTDDLTVFTTSYATGGFEPNLSLFGPTGNFITGEQYPGGPYAVDDPNTGLALDGYFTANDLAPGTYTVALTDFELQQSPSATNLSDGFTFDIGDGIDFIDEDGNTRTGNYALTLDVVPVPEPATIGALIGVAGLAIRRRLARR